MEDSGFLGGRRSLTHALPAAAAARGLPRRSESGRVHLPAARPLRIFPGSSAPTRFPAPQLVTGHPPFALSSGRALLLASLVKILNDVEKVWGLEPTAGKDFFLFLKI